MFDISKLPIGEEGDLIMAIKLRSREQNVNELLVSSDQFQWVKRLPSFYNHNTHGKTIYEYYSPFGEHLVEVKHEN